MELGINFWKVCNVYNLSACIINRLWYKGVYWCDMAKFINIETIQIQQFISVESNVHLNVPHDMQNTAFLYLNWLQMF